MKNKPWNKKLDESQELEVIKRYKEGESCVKLSHDYGFKTHKSILDCLDRYGVVRRSTAKKTYYREDFFNEPLSPVSAYCLGLIAADGYILKDHDGFAIQLTEKDVGILKKISSYLGKSVKIMNISYSNRRRQGQKAKDMVRLNVHNRPLSFALKKWGIKKHKSLSLKMSKRLPNKLKWHFLRGCFDGDGSLGIAKTGNIWCRLTTASEKFAYQISEYSKNLKVEAPVSERKTFTVRVVGGNAVTIRFLKNLYNNSNGLFLDRKYEKVKDKIS